MYNLIKAILDKPTRLAVGVMSGTSFDGLDIAFVEITGSGTDTTVYQKYHETIPYTAAWKAELLMNSSKETSSIADVCRLNKQLGVFIGEAVLKAAKNGGINMDDVDFISSHGQTMFHMPEIGATVQIGELADIAARTGKVCVGDFRPSDMAFGGQGAPLVPFADYLLSRCDDLNRVLFNVGGIGNITILPAGCGAGDVRAFDIGPGTVITDNLMRLHTKGDEDFDYCGSIARTGNQSLKLSEYLADADHFLMKKPPKSTGREHYTIGFAERIMRRSIEMGLKFPDVLATVTNHTAYALWYALTYFNDTPVDEIIVSGGGANNVYLMRCLDELFPGKVKKCNDEGSYGKYAQSFAILGNEFLHGKPNNMRGATGADRNVVMGKLVLPSHV